VRTRFTAIMGSIVFFFVAPLTVAGWLPYAISNWQIGPPLFGLAGSRPFGAALLMLGIAGLIDSFARFAWQGRGTPAPIAPPELVVVSGLYRYARNPMYISIISAIAGQAFVFGDIRLLQYAAVVWLLFHLFVIGYEEPTLRLQFGRSYDAYRAHVPRWLPRLRPWVPTA
jgi:protein-S-isoprenylcysteine O-methyltransferase Ste14